MITIQTGQRQTSWLFMDEELNYPDYPEQTSKCPLWDLNPGDCIEIQRHKPLSHPTTLN